MMSDMGEGMKSILIRASISGNSAMGKLMDMGFISGKMEKSTMVSGKKGLDMEKEYGKE